MTEGNALDDLLPFLSSSARQDLRIIAVNNLKGLTSSTEGQALLKKRRDYIARLVLLSRDVNADVQKAAIESIANLCSVHELALKFVSEEGNLLVETLLALLSSDNESLKDVTCIALANMSRDKQCCQIMWQFIHNRSAVDLNYLITFVCQDSESLHHLAMFLCNLSQLQEFRREILRKESGTIKRLLPLVNYPKSSIRRKGIVGLLRNCCFETEYHKWLLSNDVDILVSLVYPLAGPEEFSDDEMEKLPTELQYLGEDKKREPDAEIRQMLIEAINQLCAKKEGRLYIREQNIYFILRELHRWEPVNSVTVACENLVDILIGDEPKPGMENLKGIEIPDDVQKRLQEIEAALHDTP